MRVEGEIHSISNEHSFLVRVKPGTTLNFGSPKSDTYSFLHECRERIWDGYVNNLPCTIHAAGNNGDKLKVVIWDTDRESLTVYGLTPGTEVQIDTEDSVLGNDVVRVDGVASDGLGAATMVCHRNGFGDLGYKAHPGTLNLATPELVVLQHPWRVLRDSFSGLTFLLWHCNINGQIAGHCMTRKDGLEVLAPVHLRRFFGLENGDPVTVDIYDRQYR